MSGRWPIPFFDDIGDALAADFGDEETAVEQNGVGLRAVVGGEEGGEMAGDGGVGDVGQAEFAEEALLLFLGFFVEGAEGEEAFEGQFERFLAEDFGFESAAD